MKKILGVLVLGVVVVGCAGTIWTQKGELRAAYERGELSSAQYYQLEQNRRAQVQELFNNLGQGLQNTAGYLQNERAINQTNMPQTIYVVPMR